MGVCEGEILGALLWTAGYSHYHSGTPPPFKMKEFWLVVNTGVVVICVHGGVRISHDICGGINGRLSWLRQAPWSVHPIELLWWLSEELARSVHVRYRDPPHLWVMDRNPNMSSLSGDVTFTIGAIGYFVFLLRCPPRWFYSAVVPISAVVFALMMVSFWFLDSAPHTVAFIFLSIAIVGPTYLERYNFYFWMSGT